MIKQKLLPDNLFAFHMSLPKKESLIGGTNYHQSDPQTKSSLTFGWINPAHYHPETLMWHSVEVPLFWSLPLKRLTMDLTRSDGEMFQVSLCDNGEDECLVTPDSGTSSLTFPGWANQILQETYFGEAGMSPYAACES